MEKEDKIDLEKGLEIAKDETTSAMSVCDIRNENTALIKIKDNSNKRKQATKRKMGRTKGFYFINGEPVIVIGPHWQFFICLLTINITIAVILFTFLWNKINWLIFFLGVIIALTQLTSYILTALINPGLPKAKYEDISPYSETDNSVHLRRCKDCDMVINTAERTFHCYDCEICIEGYDHHCPWTSKCIGRGNLRYFYTFIISTMLLLAYLILSTSLISASIK